MPSLLPNLGEKNLRLPVSFNSAIQQNLQTNILIENWLEQQQAQSVMANNNNINNGNNTANNMFQMPSSWLEIMTNAMVNGITPSVGQDFSTINGLLAGGSTSGSSLFSGLSNSIFLNISPDNAAATAALFQQQAAHVLSEFF